MQSAVFSCRLDKTTALCENNMVPVFCGHIFMIYRAEKPDHRKVNVMMAEKKRLALMGCGFLGNIVANAWKNGLLPDYELVGVASRSFESAQKTSAETGAPAFHTLEELLAQKPDYMVETGGIPCVHDIAIPTLEAGVNLVMISIGALADAQFKQKLADTARANGVQVHIASGAVGGFDVLQTITLMAQAQGLAEDVELHNLKGPNAMKGTPMYTETMQTEETEAFLGTAAEAIALLPTRVNVAVATSLATTGPDHARSHITTIPGFVGDTQKITAEIEGYKTVVDTYSCTSAIAGWSIVALLRNLNSPICLF